MAISARDIGRTLRQLREAAGLDRPAVCELMGISESRLRGIEQGLCKQGCEEMSRLCQHYGWRLSAVIAIAEGISAGDVDLLREALELGRAQRTVRLAECAALQVATPARTDDHGRTRTAPAELAAPTPWSGGLPSQAECERIARQA